MIHILTIVDTERNQTATQPASEQHQGTADEPGEQTGASHRLRDNLRMTIAAGHIGRIRPEDHALHEHRSNRDHWHHRWWNTADILRLLRIGHLCLRSIGDHLRRWRSWWIRCRCEFAIVHEIRVTLSAAAMHTARLLMTIVLIIRWWRFRGHRHRFKQRIAVTRGNL